MLPEVARVLDIVGRVVLALLVDRHVLGPDEVAETHPERAELVEELDGESWIELCPEMDDARWQRIVADASARSVEVDMTLTAPGCGMGEILVQDAQEKIGVIPTVADVQVYLVFDPPWKVSTIRHCTMPS